MRVRVEALPDRSYAVAVISCTPESFDQPVTSQDAKPDSESPPVHVGAGGT